jgi:hypothetical protein
MQRHRKLTFCGPELNAICELFKVPNPVCSFHCRAVGEALNPHRANGWIVRRLHQFPRKRADHVHAVRLEEAEEIRVPIAEDPVEHRRLCRVDHPRHTVGPALQNLTNTT